ncbi:MAG TPA: peptide chain release factor N(5)-glutamine methyltransferase [Stellaceae bacterium]|jgi:release factor glutamine methyltransferase|nr:peptide chain release factor N(5)-glutamine methyltransferase [Stellaceae bacterium]
MTLAADTSVRTALSNATARLGTAGISDARREARLLVAAALGWEVARVLGFPELEMTTAANQRLETLLVRRSAREPVSRILGYREFWSLRFALSADTLDPRADSETLIEASLAALDDRERAYRVLDFGTGTGCLLLALLAELPHAVGIGTDCSQGALETARQNAAALDLGDRARFVRGNWGDGLSGQWDVVLANPPYVASRELDGLMPEVARYEPRLALDGGADGLTAYRALAPEIARLLAPAGIAAIEVGAGQAPAVAATMAGAGLVLRAIRHDLSGVDRCLVLGRD